MSASDRIPPRAEPAGAFPEAASLDIAFLAPEDRQTGTYYRWHNLARALVQLGHGVTVYSQNSERPWRSQSLVRDGVSYRLAPRMAGSRFLMAPVHPGNIGLRLLSAVAPADVYHLFQPFPTAAVPWLALRERRSAGVWAYDWDDFWMNDEFGLLKPRGINARVTALWVRFLERYLPRRGDLLTTVSHGLASLANGLGSPRVRIVYNGVWPEERMDRAAARAQLDLTPDAIYAGMMGWSGEIDWTLRGMREAARRFPRLRIAWCGQDPRPFLTSHPEVAERVDFRGFLQGPALRAFRHSLDLGLLPMRDSPFNRYRQPVKINDFLGAGVPVLTTAVGETQVLARRLTGVITCGPDEVDWTRTFCATIGRIASEGVAEFVDVPRLLADFSWLALARELVAAYQSCRKFRPSAV